MSGSDEAHQLDRRRSGPSARGRCGTLRPRSNATTLARLRSTCCTEAGLRPARTKWPSSCRVGPAHCCAGPPSEPGRAAFTASGSSKPGWLVGVVQCRAAAFAAVGVYETGVSLLRRARFPRRDRVDRLAGGGEPLFPLPRVLWPVLDGDQCATADHAATILGFDQPLGGHVDRQGRFAPPAGPVFGEGGVVW